MMDKQQKRQLQEKQKQDRIAREQRRDQLAEQSRRVAEQHAGKSATRLADREQREQDRDQKSAAAAKKSGEEKVKQLRKQSQKLTIGKTPTPVSFGQAPTVGNAADDTDDLTDVVKGAKAGGK